MIKAIWAIITNKVIAKDVIKLADRTHFLSAYGKRKGGRVKAGVKATKASAGTVKVAPPIAEPPAGDWDI